MRSIKVQKVKDKNGNTEMNIDFGDLVHTVPLREVRALCDAFAILLNKANLCNHIVQFCLNCEVNFCSECGREWGEQNGKPEEAGTYKHCVDGKWVCGHKP